MINTQNGEIKVYRSISVLFSGKPLKQRHGENLTFLGSEKCLPNLFLQ